MEEKTTTTTIASILRGKTSGLKLWSDTLGDVYLSEVKNNCSKPIEISLEISDGMPLKFIDLTEDGKFIGDGNVAPCIVPSKEMRDWEKLAWKKGDVLTSKSGEHCMFTTWTDENYTSFLGCYSTHNNYDSENCKTAFWHKTVDKIDVNSFISKVESFYGGKFNRETLMIEDNGKQEFKDGDIVSVSDCYGNTHICIVSNICGNLLSYHASNYHIEDWLNLDGKVIRLATDSEKQQLIDNLSSKGFAWDADKRTLVGLPITTAQYHEAYRHGNECEFKTFDKVLARNTTKEKWTPALYIEKHSQANAHLVCCLSLASKRWMSECIPFEGNEHLMNTTNEYM